jgi:hypothetical protein
VTIEVHVTSSAVEHITQGNLNPCSWVMVQNRIFSDVLLKQSCYFTLTSLMPNVATWDMT